MLRLDGKSDVLGGKLLNLHHPVPGFHGPAAFGYYDHQVSPGNHVIFLDLPDPIRIGVIQKSPAAFFDPKASYINMSQAEPPILTKRKRRKALLARRQLPALYFLPEGTNLFDGCPLFPDLRAGGLRPQPIMAHHPVLIRVGTFPLPTPAYAKARSNRGSI